MGEPAEVAIRALQDKLETRLDAMDKAIELLQAFTDRQPTTAAVEASVASLKELVDEKFKHVNSRFIERDARNEERQEHNKFAFNAARDAVMARDECNAEAATKSDLAFTKQIDQLANLVNTVTNNLSEKINGIERRVTATESQKQGSTEGIGMIGAIIVGAISFIGTGVAVAALINSLVP